VNLQFAALVERFAGRPGVQVPGEGPRRFGADALRVDGHIFAMEMGGRLVVKLSAARVQELIASGVGEPFSSGKGRPMREWVSLPLEESTFDLATEAYSFVSGR
jgi:hypothetical protein